MKKLRVYLDTSVIGGCFDEEFRDDSLQLMSHIRLGIFTGLISNVTIEELEGAPDHVRNVIKQFDDEQLVHLPESETVESLARAYLDAGVVPRRYEGDATHIAFATVHEADVVVSWNFRHIVNLRRIQAFNAINIREGYGWIEIRSPKELIYGKEEEGI